MSKVDELLKNAERSNEGNAQFGMSWYYAQPLINLCRKYKAALEFYANEKNYNHFPATSDPNCMDFVGFIEEREPGELARQVLFEGDEIVRGK